MNSNTVGKHSFLEEYEALVRKYNMHIHPGYGDPYVHIFKDWDSTLGLVYSAQEQLEDHLKDIKDNTDFDTAN